VKASLKEALEELKSLGNPAEPPPAEEDDVAPAALMRYSIDFPYSRFAETLRSAKVMFDLKMKSRGTKVIGMVSFSPDEGKTVVAKNFASLLARQGSKVLLIDADLRSHGLTRSLEREILELQPNASKAQPLKQTLWREPGTGLYILPCNYADDDTRIAEGLSPETLLPFLQNAERNFDYVVIDFPPVSLVPSALGLAPTVDAFVLVVRWGVTPRAAVKAALKKEHIMREKMLGAILNCVEMDELAMYEPSGSDRYYLQDYNVYSRTARKSVQQG
jgi:succinoglycan biosynthesis transport protein ExoP